LTSTTATNEETKEPIPNVTFENGTNEEELQSGSIDNASGLRLGLQLTAGYDIEMSDHSVLSPMFTYEMPLTTVRPNTTAPPASENWKILTLFATVSLKFKI